MQLGYAPGQWEQMKVLFKELYHLHLACKDGEQESVDAWLAKGKEIQEFQAGIPLIGG